MMRSPMGIHQWLWPYPFETETPLNQEIPNMQNQTLYVAYNKSVLGHLDFEFIKYTLENKYW